jgi:hypothetical protein
MLLSPKILIFILTIFRTFYSKILIDLKVTLLPIKVYSTLINFPVSLYNKTHLLTLKSLLKNNCDPYKKALLVSIDKLLICKCLYLAVYEFKNLVHSVLELNSFKLSQNYLSLPAQNFLNTTKLAYSNPYLPNYIQSVLEESKFNSYLLNDYLRLSTEQSLGFKLKKESSFCFKNAC